jgi:hypothetical protein
MKNELWHWFHIESRKIVLAAGAKYDLFNAMNLVIASIAPQPLLFLNQFFFLLQFAAVAQW